jgi:hypothetical protein
MAAPIVPQSAFYIEEFPLVRSSPAERMQCSKAGSKFGD